MADDGMNSARLFVSLSLPPSPPLLLSLCLSFRRVRRRSAERSKPSRGLTSLGWRRSLLFSVVVSSDEQLFPSCCGAGCAKARFPFSQCKRENVLPLRVRSTVTRIKLDRRGRSDLSFSLFLSLLSCHFSSSTLYIRTLLANSGRARARDELRLSWFFFNQTYEAWLHSSLRSEGKLNIFPLIGDSDLFLRSLRVISILFCRRVKDFSKWRKTREFFPPFVYFSPFRLTVDS